MIGVLISGSSVSRKTQALRITRDSLSIASVGPLCLNVSTASGNVDIKGKEPE
jgi:hypothetical protein